jgi:peptidoglycan hydrolase-like protein with peptidoglycan-binding domain
LAELGYNPGKSFSGVDPRLADLMQLAIVSYDDPSISKVNIKSGKRVGDKRQHGKGNAVDITLIGKDGKEIPDYQDSKNFGIYQKFANHVRSIQQQLYPDLAKDLRWGGYFSGSIGKGGKYGAMDLMHFDLAGSALGMKAGSWENGLSDQWAKAWGITKNAAQSAGESVGLLDNPSGSSITPSGLNKTQQSVFDQVNSLLDQQGWSEHAKAAILANMSRESGFNPNATNNAGERSYGLFQWNGDRQDAMRAWAKAQGLDPASVEAQVGFFNHELNTTEKAAGDALRNATDAASANAGMRRFERYGGGDAEEQARLQTTNQFLGGDYSAIRPARTTVLGTPTANPSLDPSAMQLAFNDAGIKDLWGSPLKVDGIDGPRTMTARDAALNKAPTLSAGSSDKEIAAVQAALNNLGARGLDGNSLTVDGKFGPNTEYAISQLRPINRKHSPREQDDGILRPQWTIADKTKNPITNFAGVVSDIGDGISTGIKNIFSPIENIFKPDAPAPVSKPAPVQPIQSKPIPSNPAEKLAYALLPVSVDVPSERPKPVTSLGIGSDAKYPLTETPETPAQSKLAAALAGGGIGSDAKYPTQEVAPPYYADEILAKNMHRLQQQDQLRDFTNKNRIRAGSLLPAPTTGFSFTNLLNSLFGQ